MSPKKKSPSVKSSESMLKERFPMILDSPAIELDSVSKLFYKQEQRTFKELIPAILTGKQAGAWFWALQNINLTIRKGETIGIVGPNGSGKSTLLKLIAGVSTPNKGAISVHGTVAPLIGLGAGFHSDLTGRENVFLNATILGMSMQEIHQKFESIVDFAELWDFIDQPVKHYSSGMYLRLAFAVAVHTSADIILLDEILAVGDASFQQKCFMKIREFQRQGRTIVLVTHNPNSVREYCSSAVYINHSRLVSWGVVEDVLKDYEEKK